MPLEIIGPGFGRTGTNSLKIALEHLGFGPCHHMFEVRDNPEQSRRLGGIGARREGRLGQGLPGLPLSGRLARRAILARTCAAFSEGESGPVGARSGRVVRQRASDDRSVPGGAREASFATCQCDRRDGERDGRGPGLRRPDFRKGACHANLQATISPMCSPKSPPTVFSHLICATGGSRLRFPRGRGSRYSVSQDQLVEAIRRGGMEAGGPAGLT